MMERQKQGATTSKKREAFSDEEIPVGNCDQPKLLNRTEWNKVVYYRL
jgi:hypothetical protein